MTSHIVQLGADGKHQLAHWLETGSGALPLGRVTFESVEGGGILVRTAAYPAPGDDPARAMTAASLRALELLRELKILVREHGEKLAKEERAAIAAGTPPGQVMAKYAPLSLLWQDITRSTASAIGILRVLAADTQAIEQGTKPVYDPLP